MGKEHFMGMALNQNRIICNLSLIRSKPPEHVSSSSGFRTLSAVSTYSPVFVNCEILFL